MYNLPKPFFVLAPMDDVTDTVFRRVVGECAAPDLYFTEFVNVDGLQSPGRPRLLKKLAFTEHEQPLIAQIWGKNPENFKAIAQQIADGSIATEANKLYVGDDKKASRFAGIDLNFGCPDKAVVKNGCCSALINERERAGEIIDAVRAGAGDHFPISVKTRVGFTTIDLSWIEFLLSKKLNMLTIHGRTVKELSKVPAHWDVIGEVVKLRDKLSPSTLIVGNGDVLSRRQGEELAQEYGLDGIMIGRGIFHDPYAFAHPSPWPAMTKQERVALYKKHVELFAQTWANNERRVPTLNKFCKIYIQDFDGAKDLREKLMNAESTDELLNLLS